MEFDQSITWRGLEERLAGTTNPRHRQMLETVITHAKAAGMGDVEAIMTTLSDDPEYRFWSGGNEWGPKGREAVRAFYDDLVASGASFVESAKPRIVVDDDHVVTECVLRMIIPGSVAKQRGYDTPDINGHYLVSARTTIFWPFDANGKLAGKEAYDSVDLNDCTLVSNTELPAEYLSMLLAARSM